MKQQGLPFFLSAIFALSVLAPAAAQSKTNQGLLDFGIKGGLALPSFFWTGDTDWNPATNFAIQGEAYIYSCLNLSPTFGIEMEAGYRGKGCSVDASDGYAHWYMDYLEVPLWAKWSTPVGEHLRFYGGLGGYAACFLGGRYDFSTDDPGLDGSGRLTSGTADDPTVVRPFDCGALFVVGGESNRICLEFRFSVSVIPSLEFTPPPSFGGERGALNGGIDLLVGYRF